MLLYEYRLKALARPRWKRLLVNVTRLRTPLTFLRFQFNYLSNKRKLKKVFNESDEVLCKRTIVCHPNSSTVVCLGKDAARAGLT